MQASLAAGVSSRRYAGTLDPLPDTERTSSVSKSAVSRRWVALTQAQLHEWLSCSLQELDLPVVMIDGIHFRDRVILVALDIDAKGNKHVLGLREGRRLDRIRARGAFVALRSEYATARRHRRRQAPARARRHAMCVIDGIGLVLLGGLVVSQQIGERQPIVRAVERGIE